MSRMRRLCRQGAIPKCGHVALVLDCCYVNICVVFSSFGSLRMRLISQFSRASGARFSETADSPETVVGRWILPAKLKALLGSSILLSQVAPNKDLMAESKSPLLGIAPLSSGSSAAAGRCGCGASQNSSQCRRFAHWHRLVKRGLNDLGTERVGRIDAVLEVHATTHSLLADVADETGEAEVTDRRHRLHVCGSYRGVSTPARHHTIPIDLIDYAPVGCL